MKHVLLSLPEWSSAGSFLAHSYPSDDFQNQLTIENVSQAIYTMNSS